MSVPALRPGLVICYSYLWVREHRTGLEEGQKDRPCVIVAAQQVLSDRQIATVLPITHNPPQDPADGVEIPRVLKAHLGLDDLPSWVIVIETNDFLWPGPDLRPISRMKPDTFDFGMLPPRFFAHVRDTILKAHLARKLTRVPRSE